MLGFGVGTSEVEHVLATQTLVYERLKNMRIVVRGDLPLGVTAKDIVMSVIGRLGAAGATGYAVEFDGPTVGALDLAGRMTLCNMIVEAGARGALIAPDESAFRFARSPSRAAWRPLESSCRTLAGVAHRSGAVFQREPQLEASQIAPLVSWGTSPEQVIGIGQRIPDPADEADATRRGGMRRALDYMDLQPGTPIQGIKIDRAFIGSCTNGRLEDLRAAEKILAGRRVAEGVRAMVVPGSTQVRRDAEDEGIDQVFIAAGFEWRQSGCSMCLAMNDDVLESGERCASSTNRNFEGRQGRGGRTHLMSPAMVAAAALAGHIADVRDFQGGI